MMQINGKTYHTLEEAAELTGYTKGTIYSYISAGTINGERMEDGQWFVSEVGMVQLRRRKKIPVVPEEAPETNPIAEVSKLIPKPTRISEGTIYIKSDEDKETYRELKHLCKLANVDIGDMTMIAVRYYVSHILSEKLQELETLEAKKKEILLGVAV